MLLIITSTGFLGMSASMTLNDLEPQNRGFYWIFLQFQAAF